VVRLVRRMVPDWLVEVVRPRPAAPPWARMLRAPLAVVAPLAVGMALGHVRLALPVAMGGLVSTVIERGGPYQGRVRRVASAVCAGSAIGLAIGLALHGRGWLTLVVVTLLALASALISAMGGIGSVTGLQLLVYTSLGLGPLGSLRPAWLVVALVLLGAVWGLGLAVLGWLFTPQAPQRELVAAVYRSVAEALDAVGSDGFEPMRRAVTEARNGADDQVLGSADTGPVLVSLLLATDGLIEATLAMARLGERPETRLTASVARLATAVAHPVSGRLHPASDTKTIGTRPGPGPAGESAGPGNRLLARSLDQAWEVLAEQTGAGSPTPPRWTEQLRRAVRGALRAVGPALRGPAAVGGRWRSPAWRTPSLAASSYSLSATRPGRPAGTPR
jgi:FUSC-like inner membrane protein yccS